MQRKIIISVLSVFVFYVLAQDLNYPVKKIDGKEYYIYTVELQEGLYSVSRKFGVKQADIIALNPEAEQGLKAGQHLIIPKISVSEKTSIKTAYAPSEFTYVVVEKKQSLYSISKNYNTPIDTILKYNPIVERSLQVGDTLRIPGKLNPKRNFLDCIFGKKQQPTETTENVAVKKDEFIFHQVKPKETLFSISRLYNVEIAEIVKLNPGSEENLKSGTEIRIPNKNFTAKVENKTDLKQAEQVNVISESLKKRNNDQPIRIAYLLPFMLDQGKVESGNERFIEFYAGSLLAINQAKEKGISLEIFAYDTDRSESKLNEIISNNELKNADLIIGPAYTNQVAIIGDFASKNRINTLIPFTSKIFEIDTNPYLIQFNPGIQQTVKFVAEQLKNRFKNSKIIFAESIDVFNTDDGKIFCELLRKELTYQKQNFATYQISNT
jgi:LysM repeat protein